MPVASFPTAFGTCALAWEEEVVTGFHLPGETAAAGPAGAAPPDWVAAILSRVQAHLAGRTQGFAEVPLAWSRVTAFQAEVYRLTLGVVAGQVTTYGALARTLGLGPGGARAVGAALGTNPWPLLVPCHRVVAANGKMTGFSGPGGVRTKTRLLALEGAELVSE